MAEKLIEPQIKRAFGIVEVDAKYQELTFWTNIVTANEACKYGEVEMVGSCGGHFRYTMQVSALYDFAEVVDYLKRFAADSVGYPAEPAQKKSQELPDAIRDEFSFLKSALADLVPDAPSKAYLHINHARDMFIAELNEKLKEKEKK